MSKEQSGALPQVDVGNSIRTQSRFRLMSYVLMTLGSTASLIALQSDPMTALLICAFLCGWSELDGLCGTSHVMALTPLRALDRSHRLWRNAVIAYTVGGTVTAAAVGTVLGVIGQELGLSTPNRLFLIVILILALSLLARELRWIRFALPQVHRQTNRMWAFEFGFVPAAAMWGAHIGLGFATVVAHGGWFILVGFAIWLGPLFGAMLLASYWLGRTLPIWIAPLSTDDDSNGGALADAVLRHQSSYQHVAAAGIAIAAAAALVILGLPQLS